MRILFLIRSLEAGGAERQLVLLANGLARRGHDVGVAVFYPGGVLERQLDGPELFSLEKKGRWDLVGFWRSFRKCLHAFGPEVLHGYLGTANNLSVLAKAFQPSLKVVWGIRGTKVDFAHYGKLARLDSLVQSLLSRFADRIIANSARGKQDAIADGVRADRFEMIPNGIDTEVYKPDRAAGQGLRRQWGIGPDVMVIGNVSRLDPMKDHEIFLAAAQKLAAVDPSLRFVCVGGGPLAASLKRGPWPWGWRTFSSGPAPRPTCLPSTTRWTFVAWLLRSAKAFPMCLARPWPAAYPA